MYYRHLLLLSSKTSLQRMINANVIQKPFFVKTAIRFYSTANTVSSGESLLTSILKTKFPNAQVIEVRDISGGCGSMYEVYVKSSEFQSLNTVKQHRLVTEALKAQIKEMHGVRIHTEVVK